MIYSQKNVYATFQNKSTQHHNMKQYNLIKKKTNGIKE